MAQLTRKWLEPFDWEIVTEINRGLCKQKNALHKPTSDGHDPAKNLWKKNQFVELALTEAFEVCLKCHRLAPFCSTTEILLLPSLVIWLRSFRRYLTPANPTFYAALPDILLPEPRRTLSESSWMKCLRFLENNSKNYS